MVLSTGAIINFKIIVMSFIKKSKNLFPDQTDNFFLDKYFDSDLLNFNPRFWKGGLTPLANINESKDKYKIDLSVPGLKKEDFKIEVDNGILQVSCEKQEDVKETSENYKRKEFSYSSFSRSFQLPDNINEEGIDAKYDNGILTILIPKKEISMPKQKKTIQVG